MKKKKLTEKQIQKALGADYSIKLKSGNEHGPLGWLHQMHEVQEIQRRLRAKKYTCGCEANGDLISKNCPIHNKGKKLRKS